MFSIRKAALVAAAFSTLAFTGTTVSPALAADDVYMLSVPDALATADAHDRLDGSVKFYFGDGAHPAVVRRLGDFVTNQKTNGFAKGDFQACSWVFLSALLEFQKRAHDVGADAVINIHSYYKKEDVSIDTQVPCHKGFWVGGIALRGEFVRIR
ncbi:MAG TPA: hypothetical protein VHU87_14890 [Rhizomicrobium sp.]|jgi:hypothetical protein|nr:hypothetical protein [Rhizomicrobium sp.]